MTTASLLSALVTIIVPLMRRFLSLLNFVWSFLDQIFIVFKFHFSCFNIRIYCMMILAGAHFLLIFRLNRLSSVDRLAFLLPMK